MCTTPAAFRLLSVTAPLVVKPVAAVIVPVLLTVKVPPPMLRLLPCRAAVVVIVFVVLIVPKPLLIEPALKDPTPVTPLYKPLKRPLATVPLAKFEAFKPVMAEPSP